MTTFPRLLQPGSLGPLALPNRIALCPMGVNLGEPDGSCGDDLVAWFAARARGGAGLILVGSASVAYPDGSYDARQVALSDDRFLPGLQRLTAAVHAAGATIAAQLVHDGGNSLLDISRGQPLLVPSKRRPPPSDELSLMLTPEELADTMGPFSAPSARYAVKEATEDDLTWVVSRFASAARRAVEAGFDAVEIHAGHGYLIDAFLSPQTNRRDDRWGGGAAARAMLLVEVVRAVRAAVGAGVAVWARIGAEERHRSPGQTVDDALVAGREAVAAGLDAVHVTAYAEPTVATGITDGHTPHVPGALLDFAARFRAELGVPVIAMGRLTPEAAEAALADGAADVIAMGRPLIADPDLPRKLAAGRRDTVRPCAYQYRCIGSIFRNQPLRCTVNADAGREAATVAMAVARRSVLVVGGGPAGLETARRLADRGHDVELWEASDRLGGTLRIAELADADLLGLADWLAGAAVDAGVRVRLGVAGEGPPAGLDLIVDATGGRWDRVDGALTPDDLGAFLGGDDDLLGAAVDVVGSSKAALSIARAVRARGRAVRLLSADAVVAPELGLPGRFNAVASARSEGVDIVLGAGLDDATAGSLVLVRRAPPQPLTAGCADLRTVGDVSGTAGLFDAMAAAREIALAI